VSDIIIVGGGFAAVWTAAAATRRRHEADLTATDLSITLVAPDEHMVIRPRLYEPHPERMRIALHRVLEPIGVDHVRARGEDIDVEGGALRARDQNGVEIVQRFQRIVIAAGSRLVRPPAFPGAEKLHDIDTLSSAVALDEHLHALPALDIAAGRYTAVVIGAGFVGLELATELVSRLRAIADSHGAAREVRVVLVERDGVVGPELGPGVRPAIEEALDSVGVERSLGTSVVSVDHTSVRLDDGTQIPAATAVWTAGMRASAITQCVPGARDPLGRLDVDRYMRVVGVATAFAAGDTASTEVAPGQKALQSCQYAHQMGKHAGHNVVADLLGEQLIEFRPDPYVTCIDLGEAGAVYTEGLARVVVATGEAGKNIKRSVNQELIYPPLDDGALILRCADHLSESGPARPAERQRAGTVAEAG
jgi:NADH dehydrogenase